MSASPRELERDNDDEHSDVESEYVSTTADTCLPAAAAAAAAAADDDDDVSMNVNCTSETPRPPLCVSTVTLPLHAL